MVPPSNRARPAVRCRTAFPQKCRDGGPGGRPLLPVGHSSSNPLARSLLDRSSGPFSFRRRSRHGPSAPRRECGVRRREPLCGATGVYQIKGAPAALCAVGNKREWGAESASPWGRKKCALRAQRKIRAAFAAKKKKPAFRRVFPYFLKKYYKSYFSLYAS